MVCVCVCVTAICVSCVTIVMLLMHIAIHVNGCLTNVSQNEEVFLCNLFVYARYQITSSLKVIKYLINLRYAIKKQIIA
jgi:hypothetical protein